MGYPLKVTISLETAHVLVELAAEKGITLQDFVREILDQKITKEFDGQKVKEQFEHLVRISRIANIEKKREQDKKDKFKYAYWNLRRKLNKKNKSKKKK